MSGESESGESKSGLVVSKLVGREEPTGGPPFVGAWQPKIDDSLQPDTPEARADAQAALADPDPLGLREGIVSRVRAQIVNQLDVREEDLKPDTSLLPGITFAIDSLSLVELHMAIEDEFDIDLEERDLEGTATVADLCAVVVRKLGA